MKKLLIAPLFLLLASSLFGQAPATPQISPSAGPYQAPVLVTITSTPGYLTYYTTDGSAPTAASKLYTAPFTVPATAQVRAVALVAPASQIASSTYTITIPNPCLVSGLPFTANSPISVSGTFRVSFDATPSLAKMDGVVGLANGPATTYSSMGPIIRFNNLGFIDAMNGANFYASLTPVPYLAGASRHFILDVNLTAKTYTVSVDGVPLGSNYAFRPEQAALASITTINTESDSGSILLCNIAVAKITPPVMHTVGLSWNAVTTPVAATGYNIYHSLISGGPYTKVNAIPITTLTYTDNTVTNGNTYFYVATAVAADGTESAFSTQVTAIVPLLRKAPAQKGIKKINAAKTKQSFDFESDSID